MGIHEAWTSVYLPQLLTPNKIVRITPNEATWITLFFFFGTLLGCSVTLLTTDKFGRKVTILLTTVPFFLSFIALPYTKSVIYFCIIRIIAGIASGVNLVVIPLYIGEIADPKIRGTLGTFIYIFNLIGFLLMNVIGSFVSISTSSLLSLILPLTVVLVFSWMPESPYYLAMKNDVDEATKSLIKLKGTKNIEDETRKFLETVRLEIESQGKFSELFTKKTNRRALFIQFILLNGKQFTGDDLFDVYAQLIFGQFLDNISPTVLVAVFYTVKLLVTIFSSLLIDKIGRRTILMFSFMFSGILLLLLGVYLHVKKYNDLGALSFKYLAATLLILFAIAYSFVAPVPAIIVGELFPMNVKVFASLLSEIYFCILSMVVIYFYEVTSKYFGASVPFFTFAISSLIHVVLVYLFVIETKGITLEDIQKTLNKTI
ncbi:Facilitated trehalose transporter Tret1-2 homolog-like Protein [Tribolium castaneum]|uniref:Facilitated trehalose transporter Tret1-2 homolog-like Protein n=2 Tax=Tribolium castaneum TaxID=7070 RepID=D1ZZW9_TRICA|nr:Facilitated trehalose transporter Tret1-2 homolog-like Protein [Tribolium castaneum]